MKLTIAITLVATSLPSLILALPTNTTTSEDVNKPIPPSITSDGPNPPKKLCLATSVFVQQTPHRAMRQDDCWNLAARKQWDPQGAWVVWPRRSEDDYQLIDVFDSCAFYVQRADDKLGHALIGTADVFQAIIDGSQKYVDGARMVDSVSGLTDCYGGPVRWILSPKR